MSEAKLSATATSCGLLKDGDEALHLGPPIYDFYCDRSAYARAIRFPSISGIVDNPWFAKRREELLQ